MRKKKKFYEKFIKTRQKYYESICKSYRNKLSYLIKASQKKYYTDYIHTNAKNIKNICKGTKEIITLKPRSINMPTGIVTDKSVLTDAKWIANVFNDFFSSVGNQLASSIATVAKSVFDFLSSASYSNFVYFQLLRMK